LSTSEIRSIAYFPYNEVCTDYLRRAKRYLEE